jgi:2-(1,2-epoxy-1,2-dihydrophenyl)acetyl-CoA isomerase
VTKLVGPAKAREIYYFSDRLDAQECLRIGLVNWLVADDVLEEEAMTLARRLAKGPPLAYRGIKENINAAESLGMRETVQIESRNMVRTMKSEDGAEARQAFLEKRSPIFSGR